MLGKTFKSLALTPCMAYISEQLSFKSIQVTQPNVEKVDTLHWQLWANKSGLRNKAQTLDTIHWEITLLKASEMQWIGIRDSA